LRTSAERQAVKLAWTKPSAAREWEVRLLPTDPCFQEELKRKSLLEAIIVAQALETTRLRPGCCSPGPQLAESGYKRERSRLPKTSNPEGIE